MSKVRRQSEPSKDPDLFSCLVRDAGETAEVHLRGELDIATAPQLVAALHAALATARTVVLDLRRLVFMDCAGLTAISAADSRARMNQRRLVLLLGPTQVSRLFDMTGATAWFEMTNNLPSEVEGGAHPASGASATTGATGTRSETSLQPTT